MKVLVTGGGGQLARALDDARPEGMQLVALPRDRLDITDRAAIDRLLREQTFDLVVNCAAYTAVDRAEADEGEAMRINAAAVQDLAAAAAEYGARLVQISTDFVFDGERGRPFRPDDAPNPINAYGRSKLAGERAALATAGNLVIRTAWLYGAGGRNFVQTMLNLMRAGQPLRVVADQVGTPTHCASLARTIWTLAARKVSGIVHATDAGVASWYDFAVAIQEEALAAGLLEQAGAISPVATCDYPTPARRPSFSVLDNSATWQILGHPAHHWRVELRAMLNGLKEKSRS